MAAALQLWGLQAPSALLKPSYRPAMANWNFETRTHGGGKRGHSNENQNVSGILLQYKGVRGPIYEDGLGGQTWRRVVDPCETARLHGGNLANFFRYDGSAGAPP
ncbi:hypothetical protein V8E54_000906 [Elaphomyces granulatus]